ncbi:HD domain-containing protein [Streptomyces sp. NPDC059788]|uniref:HD domain-containing protein n=1 Tax=Streptomyces sp. NPDC059788 TaxID=3346948 RepID=UPI00365C7BA2
MIEIDALPQHPGALAALDIVTAREHPSIANHSIRTYLWALHEAARREMDPAKDFDPDLLYYACLLHDLGTADDHDGPQRFEVEGADAAGAFLAARGLGPEQIDVVWEAIALHTSPQIAERRGPVTMLTRLGVVSDFKDPGPEGRAVKAAIEERYPRLDFEAELTGAVVAQALRQQDKAPEFSWPGGLLRAHLGAQEAGA